MERQLALFFLEVWEKGMCYTYAVEAGVLSLGLDNGV